MRFLIICQIISMTSDVIGMMSAFWIKSNTFSYAAANFYFFSANILITLFYKALFPRKFGKIFYVVLALLLMIFAYYFFTSGSLTTNDRYVPSHIVICIFSLLFFYQIIKEMPTTHIQRLPVFWINSGFLIYYAGTLILWIASDYLAKILGDGFGSYWIFHNVLGIVKNVFFAIGLWQVTPRTRSL